MVLSLVFVMVAALGFFYVCLDLWAREARACGDLVHCSLIIRASRFCRPARLLASFDGRRGLELVSEPNALIGQPAIIVTQTAI